MAPQQTHGEPGWLSGKESVCQCRRHEFDLWVRKIPWRRGWQPTPVFLPGNSWGWRSLMGCGPWRCKELDTTGQEHRQTSRKPNHHGTHSQTSVINTRAARGAPACRAACGPGNPLTVCGKHLEEAGREGRSVLAPEP